ncbi:hypothetical protein F5Y18DRAFT_428974 [Xylariaceae sp. FL1019]|nr:hypothetical protein F5Y18DRAFT_428974 [Xylariaceae sp. FL1019]
MSRPHTSAQPFFEHLDELRDFIHRQFEEELSILASTERHVQSLSKDAHFKFYADDKLGASGQRTWHEQNIYENWDHVRSWKQHMSNRNIELLRDYHMKRMGYFKDMLEMHISDMVDRPETWILSQSTGFPRGIRPELASKSLLAFAREARVLRDYMLETMRMVQERLDGSLEATNESPKWCPEDTHQSDADKIFLEGLDRSFGLD